MINAFKILIVYFLFTALAIASPVTINFNVDWDSSTDQLSGPVSFSYDSDRNSEIRHLYNSPGGDFYHQTTNLTKLSIPNFPRPDGISLSDKPSELQQLHGMNLTYQVNSFNGEDGKEYATRLQYLISEPALIYFSHSNDGGHNALRAAFFRLDLSNLLLPEPRYPMNDKTLLDKALEAAWLSRKEFNVSILYDDYGINSDGSPVSNSWDGRATIANIVSTPIPGAVWLLGSALFILIGCKRKYTPG